VVSSVVGGFRDRNALWRRCRRIVARLDLPRPFDVGEFLGLLALERGRPIELIPVAGRPDLPCGLVITADDADLILYSADTSALHRRHILLHEAAHLVCGHGEQARGQAGAGSDSGSPGPFSGRAPDEALDAVGGLLPHLPAELVHRVLGRTVPSGPQEREAELVASLILYRTGRDDGLPARPPGPPSRLEAIFGLPES
jgi:hypothetical protein